MRSNGDECRAREAREVQVAGVGPRDKVNDAWDEYAPFYDWENRQTLGRKDIPFWRRLARGAHGQVLELGSGTGRVSMPLVRSGVSLVGVDRSAAMLAGAVRRARAWRRRGGQRTGGGRLTLVRGDIRALPFDASSFAMVIAPYGVLQSLLTARDLRHTLREVSRVLSPGGLFGVDLVPDVPNWKQYRDRVRLRGRAAGGARLTLIESVRHDPGRHLTTFDERYVERRGRRVAEHRFELTFRTIPMRRMAARIESAGFGLAAVLGDYRGGPWDQRSDAWIIVARKS